MEGKSKTKEKMIQELENLREKTAILEKKQTEYKDKLDQLLKKRDIQELAISGSKGGLWYVRLNPDFSYDTTEQYISPQMKEFIGYRDDEFPNSIKAWDDRCIPEDLNQTVKRAHDHFQGKSEYYESEYRIQHKDGSIRWINSTGKLKRDTNGQPNFWIGIEWDITERKKSEEELKKYQNHLEELVKKRSLELMNANERLRQEIQERKLLMEKLLLSAAAFKSIQESVITTDTDFTIIQWNEISEKIYGIKASEAIGKKLLDVITIEENYPGENTERFRSIESQGYFKEEQLHRTEKGEIWVSISIQRIEDGEKKYGWVLITMDITEKKRAEKYITWLAKFPSENPNPILRISNNGKLLYNNKASSPLLKFLNCQRNKTFTGQWYQRIKDAFMSKQCKEYEINCGTRTYSLIFAPVIEFDYINVYGHDITRRKRAKIALQQARAELEERIRERTAELLNANEALRNEIKERIKAEEKLLHYQEKLRGFAAELSTTAEREQRRLASDLHDSVGEYLAISNIKLGLLEQSIKTMELNGEVKEIRKMIDKAIQATRSLIFELFPPILQQAGLEAAVEWLVAQFKSKYKVRAVFEDDGQPKPLDDDIRFILFRAVRELLTNIIKHSKSEKFNVTVRRQENTINIIVEDEGIGFILSEVNKNSTFGIFNVCERLEPVGGNLVIESEPGKGTRAAITAPLRDL